MFLLKMYEFMVAGGVNTYKQVSTFINKWFSCYVLYSK